MQLTKEQLESLRRLILPHLATAQNAEATARAITAGFLAALGYSAAGNINLDTGEVITQGVKDA